MGAESTELAIVLSKELEAEKRVKRELEAKRKQEQEEQQKREADKVHRSKIRQTIIEDFMAQGIDLDTAQEICSHLEAGVISYVEIMY